MTMTHRELVVELRQALRHLDDPPYLENLRIAKRLGATMAAGDLSQGQALRRALRLAIAALDPGIEAMPDALDARAYQVLYRYAIAKESMTAIGADLGVSTRHAYRELQCATEALARVLANMVGEKDVQLAPEGRLVSSLRGELERLSSGPTSIVDLGELLHEILDDVQLLASERGLHMHLCAVDANLQVSEQRVVLRQALLNLLSYLVSVASDPAVELRLLRSDGQAHLHISYRISEGAADSEPAEDSPYGVAATLFESLGVAWSHGRDASGRIRLTVAVPLVTDRTVLVVDDNAGLIQLFQRFLQDHAYRVESAQSYDEARQVLQRLKPDVVILDVMMPNRDGWELLRALRRDDGAHEIPVIVCSIINDPHLAFALGADGFLHKPVDRPRLLQALTDVLAPRA